MWPSNSPDLNPVDYSVWSILQQKVYCPRIHDVEDEGGCWTTPSLWQRLCSGVVVWLHVFMRTVAILNINFKPTTFWRVLFVLSILIFVNLIDINTCKMLILHEMCYFCAWNFYTTQYGSNETKVRKCGRKVLHRILWHSLAKLCTKKLWKFVYTVFVKVTAKESVTPFYLDTVYIRINRNVLRWNSVMKQL